MKISIITLFPKFIDHYKTFGIIAKAIKSRLLKLNSIDLRKFGLDERKTVDGKPYGGGVGMVLRSDVLLKAIKSARKLKVASSSYAKASKDKRKSRVILLTPQGKQFKQKDAHRLAKYNELVFVCGRYEGFDERVRSFVDEELSIGDYVLMGGELPALVISEAVLRLRPGIIGKIESTENESFSTHTPNIDGRQKKGYMLEYPQYTKPETLEVRGEGRGAKVKRKIMKVPAVLREGNHAKINAWRELEAIKRTKKRRPDLL